MQQRTLVQQAHRSNEESVGRLVCVVGWASWEWVPPTTSLSHAVAGSAPRPRLGLPPHHPVPLFWRSGRARERRRAARAAAATGGEGRPSARPSSLHWRGGSGP